MSEQQPSRPPLETMENRLKALREHIDEYRRRSSELRVALETLTTVDPVTGVRNRAGILQAIEGAIQWNAREGTPFGVLGVKVPELADIVRQESPTVAEEAMAHVAAVLSAGVRAVDRVGRWSEGVFLVVLAKFEEAGAGQVAGRLAAMLSAVPFQVGDRRYRLSGRLTCAPVTDTSHIDGWDIARRLEECSGSDGPSHPEIVRVEPLS